MLLALDPRLSVVARELRKNMTASEKIIWYKLLSTHQYRFLRQRPIDVYIVDFYCHALSLVIEVDGETHYTSRGKEYDSERTYILEQYGLQVIRIDNNDIKVNFQLVCDRINNIAFGCHSV